MRCSGSRISSRMAARTARTMGFSSPAPANGAARGTLQTVVKDTSARSITHPTASYGGGAGTAGAAGIPIGAWCLALCDGSRSVRTTTSVRTTSARQARTVSMAHSRCPMEVATGGFVVQSTENTLRLLVANPGGAKRASLSMPSPCPSLSNLSTDSPLFTNVRRNAVRSASLSIAHHKKLTPLKMAWPFYWSMPRRSGWATCSGPRRGRPASTPRPPRSTYRCSWYSDPG
jgi:hypothetical protein